MSEETQMPETEAEAPTEVTIHDFLNAVADEKAHDAKSAFDELMSYRIADALENEKVRIASQFYGGHEHEEGEVELGEPSEEDLEAVLAQDDEDLGLVPEEDFASEEELESDIDDILNSEE